MANKKVNQMSGVTLHVPPGGGPPPHRHDFEETFVLLEGEIEAIRGNKRVVRAGQTIKVPANTPHQFHNYSSKPVRMLCICSPSVQEEFFKEVGVPVTTRTTPPPKLGPAAQADFMRKAAALAPKYRTELLEHASVAMPDGHFGDRLISEARAVRPERVSAYILSTADKH